VTSVPATKHVEALLKNDDGIFNHATKGTYICDTSTISPHASVDFNKLAKERDLIFLDTPMSGGITGAINQTLTFMVGSSEDEFERAKVVLGGMGKNFFHCGGPGTGEIAKISNNLILGISMIAAAEGMAIGEKPGMDPKQLMEILSVSTARCWSIDTYNPRPGNLPNVPASRGYEGGFQVSLVKKDLALALEVASSVNAASDMTEHSIDYYRKLEKMGYGTKDIGFVFQYIMKNYEL